MQAVILAGGKGTRLAERLQGRPKPLVDVGGVPLLDRQLEMLTTNSITSAVLLVNHAAGQIAAHLTKRPPAIPVTLVNDGVPKGTAGALLACLDYLADRFAVVYGDTLFDIDVAAMRKWHEEEAADVSLFLHPNDHPADSDLVELDADGLVRAFHAYPHPSDAELGNLVNAAFYIVERNALERWRGFGTPSDLAKHLFPAMLAAGQRIGGYVSHEYIKDVGTPARLDRAERHLADGVLTRSRRRSQQHIVFLDRDGTLNRPAGFISKPADLDLLPGAAAAVRRFNDAEMRTVLVTNQPVIARGDCTADDLAHIHARLGSLLGAHGAFLDRVEFCPHHPDGGFPGEVAALKMVCECRKPGALMIERALAALNGDRPHCWLIGDSSADMLAANRAGLLSVLVRTGERGGRDGRHPGIADFVRRDVAAAARLIIDIFPRMAAVAARIIEAVQPGEAILIGGLARTGKSGFAAAVRQALQLRGMTALTISLDQWLRPADDRQPGVEGRYDLDAAVAFLRPWFLGGRLAGTPPFYDRHSRTVGVGDAVHLPADGVLIIEGVPALTLELQPRHVHRLAIVGQEDARAHRVRTDLERRGHSYADANRIYANRQADESPVIVRSFEIAGNSISMDGLLGEDDA